MHKSSATDEVPVMLVDRKTAARALGVCEKTIYLLSVRGELPVVKIGARGLRYDVRDLRRWIDAHKAGAVARAA